MTIFELARRYYPRLWNEGRIRALQAAGRLTQGEAEQILGNNTSIAKEGEKVKA